MLSVKSFKVPIVFRRLADSAKSFKVPIVFRRLVTSDESLKDVIVFRRSKAPVMIKDLNALVRLEAAEEVLLAFERVQARSEEVLLAFERVQARRSPPRL